MEGAGGVVSSWERQLWVFEGYVDLPLLVAYRLYELGKRSPLTPCARTGTGGWKRHKNNSYEQATRSYVRASLSSNNTIQVSTIAIRPQA